MQFLRRTLGWAVIPNVTLWIIALQVCVYLMFHTPLPGGDRGAVIDRFYLHPDKVFAGEWWRLVAFVFLPPLSEPVWAFLAWWFFHLMGTALESYWGAFQYNLYLWTWWLATVVTSLLTGQEYYANGYLYQSVFLAFAWHFPDFVIRLFFVIPIRIRYLAWLDWILLLLAFVSGGFNARLAIGGAVANFLLFFGLEIRDHVWSGARRMRHDAGRLGHRQPAYYHKCAVCSATDRTHPNREFRYCSQCAGQRCYCDAHLGEHQHVTEAAGGPTA